MSTTTTARHFADMLLSEVQEATACKQSLENLRQHKFCYGKKAYTQQLTGVARGRALYIWRGCGADRVCRQAHGQMRRTDSLRTSNPFGWSRE
eukprot:447213-Amphidinium_carterae.1